MRNFLIIVFIILLLTVVGCYVTYKSVVHVNLPNGAVLHVLPASGFKNAHAAVILCPGGGYGFLETWREGYMWFPFFHFRGYTVALLEYRLPKGRSDVPTTDGSEAVKLMRRRATEWGYDSDNVGVMGFSAGGHLASSLMVSDNDEIRPDFAILFYPIVSMKKELTHQVTHDHLLGKNVSEQMEEKYSNELFVSEKTSPAYIVVCTDDKIVNPQNAIIFYRAMQEKSRPVTFHEYPSGGHGWGYRLTFAHHKQMVDDLSEWLNNRPSKESK